jgi:ABC-type glutathione transport system ATPase component
VALVIVGHRPSTLSAADKILFLKEGRVAMFGERDRVLNALQERSAQSLPKTDNQEVRPRISAGNGSDCTQSLPKTDNQEVRPRISAGNGSDCDGKLKVYRDLTCRKVRGGA